MPDHFSHQLPDTDPIETQEWLDSLDALVESVGPERARYIVARLLERSAEKKIGIPATVTTPYINTIPVEDQPPYPGNHEMEQRIRAYIRWNAAIMVIRANKKADGLGGHLSTFASSATLYEVGYNWFFRGKGDNGSQIGDHVYFQGHSSPGVYARAFLERRLDEKDLDNFRMEIESPGLSSYPHPRLMPNFWEYPTVSMGLGCINSIYQARFNRYLEHRGIIEPTDSRVWCFVGDGEMDEPESLGALAIAGRTELGNLIWVVNCNLQRLDGPVRGNGKIIQELEGVFRGAGWNVIKVIWGSRWDQLLEKDKHGLLLNQMNRTVDGEYQRYAAESGAYIREHFFGGDARLKDMVSHLTDEDLNLLPRGGHDYRKIYSAYQAASQNTDAPTVILAKTIKGWTLGEGFEGRNATHQIKKMTRDQIIELRDRLNLAEEIPDEVLDNEDEPPYYRPDLDSDYYKYITERREALGGFLPSRVLVDRSPLNLPDPKIFAEFDEGSGKREVSTTGAFTGLLRIMMKDEDIGKRIVPIVADEARTFGMDSLFREFKIYAPTGQLYEPVDHDLLLSYVEGKDGQILEEGITEAGAMAEWIAAGTSYANLGTPMLPFYIFYSMFGFQRVGDLIWSAADSRSRGFLLGATAGRTTLMGEGLQHQDGHSHLLASTIPTCQAYDPAFAYELAAIILDGMEKMYPDGRLEGGKDIFYYITVYNENYVQPARADHISIDDIVKGIYLFDAGNSIGKNDHEATILFSGPMYLMAAKAQQELAEHFSVNTELWSVTSYKNLREEAKEVEHWNRLHPTEEQKIPYVTQKLNQSHGPITAITDYMTLVPEQIHRWVPKRFNVLGTDGFGRSGTREHQRRFFEVDAEHIVISVLSNLVAEQKIEPEVINQAIKKYGIDTESAAPFLK